MPLHALRLGSFLIFRTDKSRRLFEDEAEFVLAMAELNKFSAAGAPSTESA